MKFGAHVSSRAPFSEAPIRAKELGCECMQIFVNAPQRWNPVPIPQTEIEGYLKNNKKAGIDPVIIHSIYLIGLGSSNTYFYSASQASLIDDMKKASAIGALGVNTHLGSSKDKAFEEVLDKVALAIKNVLLAAKDGPYFIIENAAGAGNIIGDTVEEIGSVIRAVDSARVKVIVDTAHAFASGYRINTKDGLDEFLEKFDREIGLNRLVGLHLNDSKSPCGSRKDRHANIGEGEIGLKAFEMIVNHPVLSDLFGIIETPGIKAPGKDTNLETLRLLAKKG